MYVYLFQAAYASTSKAVSNCHFGCVNLIDKVTTGGFRKDLNCIIFWQMYIHIMW